MEINNILEGNKCKIINIKSDDNIDDIVGWLNDSVINRFLEARFFKHSISSQALYIQNQLRSPRNYYLAIIDKETNLRVGTCNIEHDFHNSKAIIGLMIGDKTAWGKGLGTDAVKLMMKFCCNQLNVKKISAGVIDGNTASSKIFLRNGFHVESILEKESKNLNNVFSDVIRYAYFNENYHC